MSVFGTTPSRAVQPAGPRDQTPRRDKGKPKRDEHDESPAPEGDCVELSAEAPSPHAETPHPDGPSSPPARLDLQA